MRISYSSLESFQQCPQKYKFTQIDRIRVPKSPEQVFGSAIHGALKYLHGSSPSLPTIEELLNYYKIIWPRPDLIQWRTPEEEKAYFNQGTEILGKYYAKNAPLEFNIVDLETRFEAPLQDEKGETHTLAGIIDRIDKLADGSWEVIDYKTAKKMPAQREVDSSLQLSIYLIGVKARWPNLKIPQIKLSLYFLKHGEKLTAVLDENRLENTKRRILESINGIQARMARTDFPPIPSALCDWCGYRSICPMWKHKLNSELRIQDADLNQIIKEFFELKNQNDRNETRMAELKKIINDYCDQKSLERVFADDGSYITRSLQQRFSYDAGRLKEILAPQGLWEEILTVDASKLAQIIKTLPWPLQEEIKKTKILEKEFKVLKAVNTRNRADIKRNTAENI